MKRGFTLIELMVTISIMSILMSILLVGFAKAKEIQSTIVRRDAAAVVIGIRTEAQASAMVGNDRVERVDEIISSPRWVNAADPDVYVLDNLLAYVEAFEAARGDDTMTKMAALIAPHVVVVQAGEMITYNDTPVTVSRDTRVLWPDGDDAPVAFVLRRRFVEVDKETTKPVFYVDVASVEDTGF